MPIVSGPLGTLLIAGLAVVALMAWLRRRGRHLGPRLVSDDSDIDWTRLEAAEREVREIEGTAPDEPVAGRDWGPGVPRPPERL